MKNFKFLVLFLTFLIGNICFADLKFDAKIDTIVKKSGIKDSATVAISVKNVQTGAIVYEKNEAKLLHPASVLKALTTPVSLDVLGDDYIFKTSIYKDKADNVYLKLGADPILSSNNLKTLSKALKAADVKKIKTFYIDDTLIDARQWGVGWMDDDNKNPNMPKFSAYNLDGNMLKLTLTPTKSGQFAALEVQPTYLTSFINQVKTADRTKIEIYRDNAVSPDLTYLNGTVADVKTIDFPINNPKQYFLYKLNENLKALNIDYYKNYETGKVPDDAVLLAQIENEIAPVVKKILLNSDNLSSETLFKLAGGKAFNQSGTTSLGVDAFNNFYKNLGLKTDSIVIADASGVSRNNLISADFVSQALYKLYESNYKEKLAQPNYGTMKDRLFDLKGCLWAKTGTLSGVSGIAGYVETKNGKTYAFSILIENFIIPQSEVKKLEDQLIMAIYELL